MCLREHWTKFYLVALFYLVACSPADDGVGPDFGVTITCKFSPSPAQIEEYRGLPEADPFVLTLRFDIDSTNELVGMQEEPSVGYFWHMEISEAEYQFRTSGDMRVRNGGYIESNHRPIDIVVNRFDGTAIMTDGYIESHIPGSCEDSRRVQQF